MKVLVVAEDRHWVITVINNVHKKSEILWENEVRGSGIVWTWWDEEKGDMH